VVGFFRLGRDSLKASDRLRPMARRIASFAAVGFGGNPNLLYLQATAMTEPLYLALFIWATVFFSEFVQNLSQEPAGSGADGNQPVSAGVISEKWHQSTGKSALPTLRALWKCGVCLAAACLTRYDAWFVAGAACAVAILMAMRAHAERAALGRAVGKFVMLTAAAPVLWLVYNGIVYRNPLEFENGPYSAKAIERKAAVPGFPPHPGAGSP